MRLTRPSIELTSVTCRTDLFFLDTTYLRPVRGIGFVNSDYIISSLRQQLTAARCKIHDKREDAEIIVEPRVGALGTEHEITYGIPSSKRDKLLPLRPP